MGGPYTIEIEPAMVGLARHYGPVNRAVFEDPRSRIHFDDYLIVALDYGNILIVARPHGRVTLDAGAFARLSPTLRERLARLEILSASNITLHLLANKALLAPWLTQQAAPANSDFYPYLDNYADRDRFVRANWNEVFMLGIAAYPVAERLRIRPPLATPSCITANDHFGNDSSINDARISGHALLSAHTASPCPTTPRPSSPLLQTEFGILEACRTPSTADPGYGAGGVVRVLPHFSPDEGRAIRPASHGPPTHCSPPARGSPSFVPAIS